MSPADLVAFEAEVAQAFERGEIRGPVHISGGNEAELIKAFRDVAPEDWVFSTWRSHYHALLHGVPRETVMREILAGNSMNLMFQAHRFFSSAIVGGILPIALGVAAALKRSGSRRSAWCFIGDMTARTGIAFETMQYASGHDLPLRIVVEDNGLSTNTPTEEAWGTKAGGLPLSHYRYERTYPHVGTRRGRYGRI